GRAGSSCRRRAAARRTAAGRTRAACRACGTRGPGGAEASSARAVAGAGAGATGPGSTAGTAPGAGVIPHDGLDRDLDVHDAAHRIGEVLRGGAAMEGVDQAIGAEADHERAAVDTVDMAVLGDQRPAGPTDLLQLVEDRGPVAAHLIRLDASSGSGLRRCRRLLRRGGLRG